MTTSDGSDVMVICTANQCRSPAAAAVLDSALAPYGIRVSSSGLSARAGTPVDDRTRQHVTEVPAGLVAQQLTPGMLDRAALVLTMTRQHRTAVVGLVPSAVRRTFTLTEFADLAGLVAFEDDLPGPPIDRLTRLVALAPRQRGARRAGPARPDDVEDPYLLDAEGYQVVMAQVREAADAVAALVRGPSVAGPTEGEQGR